jgi:outer membrane immunogenic protein
MSPSSTAKIEITLPSKNPEGRCMKRILRGAVYGLGLAAAPAFAADMPFPVKAPPIVAAPAYSWSGFYVGANVGFGGDKFNYPFYAFQRQLQAEAPALETRVDGNLSLTSSGFFGGGQIGYNHQFHNNIVLGIEGDFQWSGIDGKLASSGILVSNNGNLVSNTVFEVGSEVEWFSTIRGRLGYAWDRTLLYATGGAAVGKVKSHGSISVSNANGPVPQLTGMVSASDTQWGWTAGAGLEYALAPQWTFKTEYLYIDLGRQTLFSGVINDVANGFSAGAGIDVKTTLHTVKAGVNYRF